MRNDVHASTTPGETQALAAWCDSLNDALTALRLENDRLRNLVRTLVGPIIDLERALRELQEAREDALKELGGR
jgi:hypothetical protein